MAERFHYEGYHKIPSYCYIEIYKHEQVTIVIATEPDADESSGTSVTNRAEQIATKACHVYNIPHDKLVWIEHYQAHHPIRENETWDLVTFDREEAPVRGYWDHPRGEIVFTKPKWYHLSTEQKDRLIEKGDTAVLREQIAAMNIGLLQKTPDDDDIPF